MLDVLAPAERLAFVLHDLFGLAFEEIAPIVGKSPDATRQLASRARRRVRGAPAVPDTELAAQRDVVNAFVAALRAGDFDGLVAVLAPDVVVRTGGRETRGAEQWARSAVEFVKAAASVRSALVDGGVGAIFAPRGKLVRALKMTVAGGKIVDVEVVIDPAQVAQLDVSVLEAPAAGAD